MPIAVRLAGATVDWIQSNTSWGNTPHESETATRTRRKVLAAPSVRMGRGAQARFTLEPDEAEELAEILDSIAGSGESMTAEERGSDIYVYRVIRRDCDRIRDVLQGVSGKG